MNWIEKLADKKKPIIGMIHLPPLPGNPRNKLSINEIIESSLNNAELLVNNRVPLLMIENYYDTPYPKYSAREEVIGAMSIIAWEIKRNVNVPIGINILRNCGKAALSVAHITGASFIRVNALSQTIVSDQGIIEPISYALSRKKKILNTNVKIMADVNVKHAAPLVDRPIDLVAKDTRFRKKAEAYFAELVAYKAVQEEVSNAMKAIGTCSI